MPPWGVYVCAAGPDGSMIVPHGVNVWPPSVDFSMIGKPAVKSW